MFEVFANDYRITIQEIPLGNQGEDMARCLVIDITDAVLEFGSGGTISVRNKRNGDELPYFCTNVSTVTGADAEGNVHTYIKWTLTDVDTAVAGSGFVQADYIISGVTVKTWVYKYFILPSLGITGDVPDPYEDILEEIEAQVSAVQTAAASAAASAAQASAEATRIISTTQEVVEDWLSEHIVTGYTVDDTLTISGAAADSKKAGDMIRASFVVGEASGSIASFADGADNVPLKDLVVNITPKQASGTPSPDNVLPITGWTEANIYRTNTNVYDGTFELGNINTSTGANVSNNNYGRTPGYIACAPSTTYYAQTDNVTQLVVYFYDATNTYISFAVATNTTFTTPSNAYKFRLRFAGASDPFSITPNVSINCPSTDHEYHAYSGNVYNVSFGSSAGTVYGGTLDVTTGMLTVNRAFISNITWTQFNQNNGYKAYKVFNLPYAQYELPQTANEPVSNMFNTFGAFSSSNMSQNILQLPTPTSNAAYMALDENADASAVQFSYLMKDPVSYQLTPTEVKTLLANNNIWSDTGSVASCEYRADTKLYIEHLTDPDSDMIADANITSGSYFMVNNSLYLATSAIAAGATIIPGTNCTATNLAAALNAINS